MWANGAEAARLATRRVLASSPNSVFMGLGANDPGRVFGTTAGLSEEFGVERVFETPTSELAMTGVGVGLAIAGHPVIHSHQRLDFGLLALDQLVNSAAKWRYMFGDQFKVPYLTRMIVGRGWGQGPTHSQNLESWFAHIPGLRVLTPATPQDLFDSIVAVEETLEPIVVIEHRWLHTVEGEVDVQSNLDNPQNLTPIGASPVDRAPTAIFTWGLAYYDAKSAQSLLAQNNVKVDVFRLRELNESSISYTAEVSESYENILVVCNSWLPASFADSLISNIAQRASSPRLKALRTMGYPFSPEPTSLRQIQDYHISDWRVANEVLALSDEEVRFDSRPSVDQPHGFNFGPF